MTLRISALFTLFSALLLSGCFGLTQPSDGDIKEMSKQYFDQQFSGLFTAVEARKDNGYKQNDTHYVAEMTLIANANQSLDDYASQLLNDESLSPLERMTQGMSVGLLKMTMPEFQAGDQLEFKRNYLFIKTDNGWMIKKELNEETDNH